MRIWPINLIPTILFTDQPWHPSRKQARSLAQRKKARVDPSLATPLEFATNRNTLKYKVVIGDFIGAQGIVQKNPVTGISLIYRTHDPEKTKKTLKTKHAPEKI